MTAVETANLTRSFGRVVAVDGLSLRIEAGELFGLLGPNGAGKTTAIRMLVTLLPLSGGRATVAGYDVAREPRRVRGSIGYVPQMLSVDGTLTGYENLLVSAKLCRIPRRQRHRCIQEVLDLIELGGAAHRMTREYSGGMIRRLEIGQCVLARPAVLFLDEPTVGLDPSARRSVWDQLLQLRQELKTTMVLTTHYMEEAEALCDRIAIMHRGKLAVVGTPEGLKADLGASATLEKVFAHHTGASLESTGQLHELARVRRTAKRLS